MLKSILKILAWAIIICVALFLIFRDGDSDQELMFAKYGSDAIVVADGNGGQIVYRDQGAKDAEVLFLVHGSNASMQTWNALIDQLADGFRIISYDQHGHGLSGPNVNKEYSATAKLDAATKVLDHAGVKQAVWIGNSMGGWLTWRAALAQPDRVSKMVLIDASGAVDQEKVKLYLGAKLKYSWFGKLVGPYITPRSIIRSSLKQNYADPSKVTDELVNTYWEMLRYPGNRKAAQLISKAQREPEKWNEIDKLKLPTLILWGEKDTVIPVSHAGAFKQKIEDSELIIYPSAGHLPQEEIPLTVANDINAWLTNLNAAE